jgi:hypothetical protein
LSIPPSTGKHKRAALALVSCSRKILGAILSQPSYEKSLNLTTQHCEEKYRWWFIKNRVEIRAKQARSWCVFETWIADNGTPAPLRDIDAEYDKHLECFTLFRNAWELFAMTTPQTTCSGP